MLKRTPAAVMLTAAMLVAAGGFSDEIPPPESHPCFPGAFYRKAVTSVDRWTGIEGVVILPSIEFDPERAHPVTGRPLDNASIYMGGRAGDQEIDAGLTWEVIRHEDGSISDQRVAFRPFWRNDAWANAPAEAPYYYYPGDTIRMSCLLTGEEELTLTVEVLDRQPDSPSQHLSTFTVAFDAPNFDPDGEQEFKRVNAIDQFGNEGNAAQPTRTRVVGAEWREVTVLRGEEDRRPMIPERFTDMRCPNAGNILVLPSEHAEAGGERIDLRGFVDPETTAWQISE